MTSRVTACGPVPARLDRLEAYAGALARAVAVLGDGCELRHAHALARDLRRDSA